MTDLRAYQPAFTAGVLAPSLWGRIDYRAYSTGMKTGENLMIHAHGGVSNRPGLEFIGEVKNSANPVRLIPFQFNTEQSYVLEFGPNYMRVYRNGGLVLAGGVPYEIATPWGAADLPMIAYAQEADVMYLVHGRTAPRKLSRLAEDNWTLTVVNFAPKIAAPAAPTVTKPGDTSGETGYDPQVYFYRVSSIGESGEESVPSPYGAITNDLTLAGGINRITWTAVPGAERYIVYKEDNGVYGYIGGTTGLVFDDENITPDLADAPQSARNPFSGAGNYPRCVSFVEQRLAFASSINDPQAVWMSQSASYENFGYSQPAKASDAVTFRIKARQVNEIRSILPVKAMMLLTSAAEWLVSGGSQSDAITPSAIRIDNQGYRGSSWVQPVVVGNTVLFAQDRGGVVRDFSYEFANDAYVGKDLTILARHLFEGREIKAWAFAQAPHSMVWVVMTDGSLASLTYMREHEVWGWTSHSSGAGAVFEDVVVIAEGQEDVPYFLVRRTVNGTTRRYLERLHSRHFSHVDDAFFVDCGLTYAGTPVTALSGLGHLEGQAVVALSDGNVVRGLTVTGGAVTLPHPAAKVHIGLPVVSSLQMLDLDLGSVPELGTVQGRMKSVDEVTLRVEKTRGIWIGGRDGVRGDEHLIEYKQRQSEAWSDAINLFTGDIRITPMWDWNTSGGMWVKQFDPLPMSILAVMPDVRIGK